MALHDGLLEWNGCSVGMLMTSESTDSLVERICVCIDACRGIRMYLVGLLFRSFSVNLAALLWILSRLSIYYFLYVWTPRYRSVFKC